MLTIQDLMGAGGDALARETAVPFRGRTVVVKALTVAQMTALKAADPPPAPPLGPDPAKGSRSSVPRPDDPKYRSVFEVWYARQRTSLFAVAAGYKNGDGTCFDPHADPKDVRAWIDLAHAEISNELTEAELNRFVEAVAKLADVESMAEDALGN